MLCALAAGQLSQVYPVANGRTGFSTYDIAHEGFSQKGEELAARGTWPPDLGNNR